MFFMFIYNIENGYFFDIFNAFRKNKHIFLLFLYNKFIHFI